MTDRYSWISMPPIPTLLMTLLLLPFSDPSEKLEMGGAFWLFVTMAYLSMSAAYVICLGRGARGYLGSLQSLSQGIALIVLPLGIGAPQGLSWVGLALSVSGAVLLVNKAHNSLRDFQKEVLDSEEDENSYSPFQDLPIPTLTSWEDGTVLRANKEMLELLGMDEELVLGQKVESFFPAGAERVEMKDQGWRIRRTAGEGGSETLYLLEEIPQDIEEIDDPRDIIHKATGLFSAAYADRIAPAELKRAVRYKRWLSLLLLKLSVVSMEQEKSEIKEISEDLYNRYGGFIMKHTRDCDLGFFMGNGLYLVLLPETPGQGAKVALEKLKKIPDDVKSALTGDASATLSASLHNCSGQEKVDYDKILADLIANLSPEVQFEHPAANLL